MSCARGNGTACDECFRERAFDYPPTTDAERDAIACLGRQAIPIVAALAAERLEADHSVTLTGQQAHMLKIFTSRWNDDRARRGAPALSRHEALSKLLSSALDLIGAQGIGT